MRIIIKATNIELTPALRQYAGKKISSLGKFLKRFEAATEVEFEIEVARTTKHHHKGDVFYAETNVRLPGRMVRAEEVGPDIRTAIDKVRNTLERELAKYKEKKIVRRGKAAIVREKI